MDGLVNREIFGELSRMFYCIPPYLTASISGDGNFMYAGLFVCLFICLV